MAAVVESPVRPIGLPRTRFTAMVAGADPERRAHLVGRLRSLGAGAVVEAGSPHEARARCRMTAAQDVCVIDSTDRDLVDPGLLTDLGRAGWHRVVVVDDSDPVPGVLAALARGLRGYVALPAPASPTVPSSSAR